MKNRGLKRLFLVGLLIMGLIVSCGGGENGPDAIDNGENIQNGQDAANSNPTGGTWKDPATGYEWQVVPSDNKGNGFAWQEAIDYCKNLNLGGYSDWHLPTIGQLRGLIRGCDSTKAGGECGVTDKCLEHSCWDDACNGCNLREGPGQDGLYGPSELKWPFDYWYWSSSSDTGVSDEAWLVYFGYGGVGKDGKDSGNNVRCVRLGE